MAEATDVTDWAAVRRLVDRTVETFGKVDVLVNDAGMMGPIGSHEEIDLDRWFQTLDVNVMGVVRTCRAVLPVMRRQRRGKIVNLSGGGAFGPMPAAPRIARRPTPLMARHVPPLAAHLSPTWDIRGTPRRTAHMRSSNIPRGLLRRSVLLSAGSIGGAAVLAACAGTAPGAQQPGAAPRAASGTVTWFVRSNQQENDWQKNSVIPNLAKQYPQLTVDLEVVAGGDFDAKLTSRVVGGQSPEVWTHHGNRAFVDYMKNGWLEELTPLVSRDKIDLGAFLPNTVEWFRNQGKLWAMPYFQSYGSFVFYNKDMFDRAGLKPPPADGTDKTWTWDAMVETAQKLTRATGGTDAQFGLQAFSDGAQFLAQTTAMLFGGDVFLPEHYKDGIAQKTQLDSPASIDGHQARQDLIFRQHVIPNADDTKALGVAGDLFQGGKIGLNLAAGWQVRNYTIGVKDFKWGIAPIPGKKKSAGPNFTDSWMLGKQSKNREGGWALIKYTVTPDEQRAFTRITGTGCTIKASEDEWYKQMGDRMPVADVKKVTEFSLKNSFELSQHTFAKWSEILTAVRAVADPLWKNQAMAADALRAGKPQVDQAVLQAYTEFKGSL